MQRNWAWRRRLRPGVPAWLLDLLTRKPQAGGGGAGQQAGPDHLGHADEWGGVPAANAGGRLTSLVHAAGAKRRAGKMLIGRPDDPHTTRIARRPSQLIHPLEVDRGTHLGQRPGGRIT